MWGVDSMCAHSTIKLWLLSQLWKKRYLMLQPNLATNHWRRSRRKLFKPLSRVMMCLCHFQPFLGSLCTSPCSQMCSTTWEGHRVTEVRCSWCFSPDEPNDGSMEQVFSERVESLWEKPKKTSKCEKALIWGKYQLVYLSPESLLTNVAWREMLLTWRKHSPSRIQMSASQLLPPLQQCQWEDMLLKIFAWTNLVSLRIYKSPSKPNLLHTDKRSPPWRSGRGNCSVIAQWGRYS